MRKKAVMVTVRVMDGGAEALDLWTQRFLAFVRTHPDYEAEMILHGAERRIFDVVEIKQ